MPILGGNTVQQTLADRVIGQGIHCQVEMTDFHAILLRR